MRKIKNISFVFIIMLTITLFPSCTSDSNSTEYDEEEYVIKTRTGECYHYEGCWTIANSYGTEEITKTEAIEDYGLRSCSQCSPE